MLLPGSCSSVHKAPVFLHVDVNFNVEDFLLFKSPHVWTSYFLKRAYQVLSTSNDDQLCQPKCTVYLFQLFFVSSFVCLLVICKNIFFFPTADCFSRLPFCIVYLNHSNPVFPSWFFLSFSSFTTRCSCCSPRERCCYHCWGCRGGLWLPQPRPCFL